MMTQTPVRRCTVLTRNGRTETLFFEWQPEGLVLTTEPQAVPELKAIDRIEQRIFSAVQPGEEIKLSAGLWQSQSVFRLEKSCGKGRQRSRGPTGNTTGHSRRHRRSTDVSKEVSGVLKNPVYIFATMQQLWPPQRINQMTNAQKSYAILVCARAGRENPASAQLRHDGEDDGTSPMDDDKAVGEDSSVLSAKRTAAPHIHCS